MEGNVTPETFTVGEWVDFYRGEERHKVKIIAVNGNEVTAHVFGQPMIFVPRSSFDGRYVKLGSSEWEVMPDIIVRPTLIPEKKESFVKVAWHFMREMFRGSGS